MLEVCSHLSSGLASPGAISRLWLQSISVLYLLKRVAAAPDICVYQEAEFGNINCKERTALEG